MQCLPENWKFDSNFFQNSQNSLKFDQNPPISGILETLFTAHKNILVIDKVTKTELSKYYNAADIFLLPSYSEGCPLSLLEALSCNLYSISTDVGGIPNIKEKIEELELIKSRDS